MKKIIGLILVSIYFTGCFFAKGNNKEELVDEMIALIEYAYMEGQRGVLEGDVRIEKIGNDYVWIKSPWDEKEEPAFKYLSEYNFK